MNKEVLTKQFTAFLIAGVIITASSFYAESQVGRVAGGETINTEISVGTRISSTTPTITASSYGAYLLTKENELVSLIEYNASTSLPIASITKIITGVVAKQQIEGATPITISFEAFNQYEKNGGLELGKVYTAQNLLYANLIESSNDAAYALSEYFGHTRFLKEMNDYVRKAGASSTKLVNPTGVDERVGENRSTIEDLALIVRETLNMPDLYAIMRTASATIAAVDGTSEYTLKSTDQLLAVKDFPLEIIGGKTGETPRAKQTLLLVTKAPNGEKIINIVLNSKDRFKDMTSLVSWTKEAISWK